MKEIWKDIPNYENIYQISNLGRIKSLRWKKGRILTQCLNKLGYFQKDLYLNGKRRKFYVHRLVILAFSGPSELECNHKNGVRNDNRLVNLEYCTKSENVKHAFRKLGRKTNKSMLGKFGKYHNRSKKVNQYTLEGKFIKTWGSIIEVQIELGINRTSISACGLGKQKTAGGFIWKYI